MKSAITIAIWLLLFGASVRNSTLTAEEQLSDQQLTFFEERIRPVLVEHCYACHSERAKKLKGELRLDLRDTSRKGGESGAAIIPGKPDASLLIQAMRYESLEMPPKGKLPDRVVADFVKWIEMGAPDPRDGKAAPQSSRPKDGRDHWAFQPIQDPARPSVNNAGWPLSDIDYFVLHRLEQEGLKPVDDADRYTWLRRVSFDLTGLPPTVDEIEQFVENTSPHAHEAAVDRLIASRAFGERWARLWLDLVGYADQIGTSNNLFAEHGWKYRDYVIDAFNDDKPFDRFIREQIAGDLLDCASVEARAESITATGFLVLGDLEVVEADKEKMRVDIIDQQVVKTTRAFLGLTVGCARCHDHKFDPIPQRDYYAIAGFFHSTESTYKTERGVWSDVIARQLPETEAGQGLRAERSRQHAEKIAAMKLERTEASKRKGDLDKQIQEIGKASEAEAARAELAKERDQLAGRIGQLNREIVHAEFFAPTVPETYGVQDVKKPANMRITIRGNPRALGDEVPRGFLTVASDITPSLSPSESGRKQFADWVASPKNPLTARVVVNRIWQKLFGEGLVRSVDYFGLRGEQPSHPELLDQLATKFVQDGWSQKSLVRSLVVSHAYRMNSSHNQQAHAADPNNQLLWRANRRRLDAEAIRDALLAVSGQLHRSAGGPALPLEFPENVANIDPTNVNPPSFSLGRWRPQQPFVRTIYLPVIRSRPQPGPAELRNVFDFTQPAGFAGKRAVTAVPTQALFLMNSPVVKEHAKALSERLLGEASEPVERLELLWLCVLNRPIADDERTNARSFLDEAGENGWTELCHGLIASNEFLMRL
ncbi:MAG: hypothetical protein CMJ64_28185 [Planctomycetaceae bacterium]|nr:hypothetical protein [Planctomycetaceae bacterium]